ncbi:MAG TPA: hypothetical protein VHX67_11385 [Acidimicrobiales bacterium]|jgi:hypothetical protein|nr:hypothetical protein [Acidimicrobiales bacterium]
MKRLHGATVGFLVLAALLLMAQFVSAFFVHVTVRAEPTGEGWVVPPTKTCIQAFGASEAILTLLSLGALILVGSVLRRRGGRCVPGAGPLTWSVSAVAAALGLVGFAYLFGVGVCLLVACATVPRRSSARSTGRRRSVASGVRG